jgi:hypothetical protein
VEKDLRSLWEKSQAAHKFLAPGRVGVFPAYFPSDAFGTQGVTTSNAAETVNAMLLPACKQATLIGSLLSTHYTLERSLFRKKSCLPNAGGSDLVPAWVREHAHQLKDKLKVEGCKAEQCAPSQELRPALALGDRPQIVQTKWQVLPSSTLGQRPNHTVLGSTTNLLGARVGTAFSGGVGFTVTLQHPEPISSGELGSTGLGVNGGR